jgi:hypothetical protein
VDVRVGIAVEVGVRVSVGGIGVQVAVDSGVALNEAVTATGGMRQPISSRIEDIHMAIQPSGENLDMS